MAHVHPALVRHLSLQKYVPGPALDASSFEQGALDLQNRQVGLLDVRADFEGMTMVKRLDAND